MKRIVTILILLTVVMSLAFWGIHSIGESRAEMLTSLEQITARLKEQNYSAAAEQTKAMAVDWEKKNNLFGVYVKHELPDQIGREISQLSALIQIEKADEATALIAEIQYDLDRLYQNELPHLKNIL